MTENGTSRGPLPRYRALREGGRISHDPAQELAAEKLQSLYHALKNYRPGHRSASWAERLGLSRREAGETPLGLYLFGPVGRGKSMLMDLFFECADIAPKRRVYFHAFMLEVHDTLHRWRQERRQHDDVMAALGDKLSSEAALLCFDEFHVVNIADAMILGRLFETLFNRGIVIVATSNWAPDDLYQGGLQRERFLPFIALIKLKMDVLDLGPGQDHRLARLKGKPVYHYPLNQETAQAMSDCFASMAGGEPQRSDHLVVHARRFDIPRAAGKAVWFDFSELCERPLAAADYIALAMHFNVVLIDGVPVLSPEKHDAARRFMILIDAMYEHRVTTIIRAQEAPERLYQAGEGSKEFERTVSRMYEMQSIEYLSKPHLT